MWQRARVLRRIGVTSPPAGLLIWVQGKPQATLYGRLSATGVGMGIPRTEVYTTNVMMPSHLSAHEAAVCRDIVELLPEFCEDPPRIPWGAWNEKGAPDALV